MNRKDQLEMVGRAINGDESAFAALAEDIADDIKYICIHILGNQQDGEDAAQDALLRIKQGVGTLKDPHSFTPWCNRIVNRSCKRVIRNRENAFGGAELDKLLVISMGKGAGFSQLTEKSELRIVVRQEIEKLPDHYQEVVYLFYYEDLPLKTIAAMMDTNSRQVITTLYRARKALKTGLENQLGKGFVPGFLIPFTIRGCILLSGIAIPKMLLLEFSEAVSRMIARTGLLCKYVARVFSQLLHALPHTAQGLEAVLVAGLALGLCGIEHQAPAPATPTNGPSRVAAVPQELPPDAASELTLTEGQQTVRVDDRGDTREEVRAGPSGERDIGAPAVNISMAIGDPKDVTETAEGGEETEPVPPKTVQGEELADLEMLMPPEHSGEDQNTKNGKGVDRPSLFVLTKEFTDELWNRFIEAGVEHPDEQIFTRIYYYHPNENNREAEPPEEDTEGSKPSDPDSSSLKDDQQPVVLTDGVNGKVRRQFDVPGQSVESLGEQTVFSGEPTKNPFDAMELDSPLGTIVAVEDEQ